MQNLSVCPDAKASPFGRGVTAGDGEGNSVRQSRRTAIGSPKIRLSERNYRGVCIFFGSVLALSGASRQLSQRESHYTLLASSSTLRFGTQ